MFQFRSGSRLNRDSDVRASNPALDKLEIHSEIESENDNRTRD